MSNKGIFTALSGAIAQASNLDTIANNVANTNTTAFKRDKQVFREYLTANEKLPDVIQVPKIPASIESFYDMQGGDRGYVDASGTFTTFDQGNLKTTGNNLDMAIEGDGFFEVLTPSGAKLTRNGAFKLDPRGRLVTTDGFPVLKEGLGQDPEARIIQINNSNITVSYTGEIYEGNNLVSKLSLVDVAQKDALQKMGSSLYTIKDTIEPGLSQSKSAKVHQGTLESSNVNIVQEMTNMIGATRAFESTQDTIKAFDSMNDKLVNDVPKV